MKHGASCCRFEASHVMTAVTWFSLSFAQRCFLPSYEQTNTQTRMCGVYVFEILRATGIF